MIKLEISAFENQSARVISISQARTTIGRNPTNDIVVDSRNVSGAHAEIVRTDDGGLKVKDLGSINGTFVNGEQIDSSPIGPGDHLRFGNVEGSLTASTEAEPIAFGSLAISQAKKAMEKLHQESPDGSDQSDEPEIAAVPPEAAGDEKPSPEAAAPDPRPEPLPDEPAPAASAGGEPADADAEIEEGAVKMDSLRMRISELESEQSEMAAANEVLTDALAEKIESITELSGKLQEKDATLADLKKEKANLEEKWHQAERCAAENTESAAAEAAALRTEVETLKEAHGEVADACAQLGAVQQEMESYGPQRVRLERELDDFLAQAEATRQAAIEENAEVRRASKISRKELEALNQAVNEAEQQGDLRKAQVEAAIREREDRKLAEEEALAAVEGQKVAAERSLEEVADATRATESECDRFRARIAKEERELKKIQRKIGRRKKLLGRLKTVARREREVARKMEEGKRFLEAAESHQANGDFSPQVQPWDVDRALADRDQALKEAQNIREKVELMKAELRDRQAESDRTRLNEPFDGLLSEGSSEFDRPSGEPSRQTVPLRGGR